MEKKPYILLPRIGLKAQSGPALEMLTSLPHSVSTSTFQPASLPLATGNLALDIIDTAAEDGPKLVSVDEELVASFNAQDPNLRLVEVVEYSKPIKKLNSKRALSNNSIVTIEIVDNNGSSVSGALVTAYTHFSSNTGDQDSTDPRGNVNLQLSGNTIERLYVESPAGYWGAYRTNIAIHSPIQVQVEVVLPSYTDCVRHLYPNTSYNHGTGVKIGVIDTGVDAHQDLNLIGGSNTVTGEPSVDYHDSDIHGTHVAGLIGANNANGLRGMAPGIPIISYRVFGATTGTASNYSILKAMIFAARDRCDIINLSLGGGDPDAIVKEAIDDARNQGMLVVAAAGNDNRGSVNYPAAYNGSTAISAMGIEGTFPTGSLEEGDIERPPSGNDAQEFIAAFSNFGPEIAMTGPGVGAISTLPNSQYGVLSGTSMAAPVISGAAACLLSNDTSIYNLPRNASRSRQIEQLIQASCVKRGFGLNFEGYGIPDPSVV